MTNRFSPQIITREQPKELRSAMRSPKNSTLNFNSNRPAMISPRSPDQTLINTLNNSIAANKSPSHIEKNELTRHLIYQTKNQASELEQAHKSIKDLQTSFEHMKVEYNKLKQLYIELRFKERKFEQDLLVPNNMLKSTRKLSKLRFKMFEQEYSTDQLLTKIQNYQETVMKNLLNHDSIKSIEASIDSQLLEQRKERRRLDQLVLTLKEELESMKAKQQIQAIQISAEEKHRIMNLEFQNKAMKEQITELKRLLEAETEKVERVKNIVCADSYSNMRMSSLSRMRK